MSLKTKKDFPLLEKTKVTFLDSAASSQKPKQVIEKISTFYQESYANVHRGIYTLSEDASSQYEQVREKVADFINASAQEIVFTSGATAAINLVVNSLKNDLKKGDEIIISQMEHHANFVPWVELRKQGIIVNIINVTSQGEIDQDHYAALLSKKTKIVALTHVSNVLGTINPIKKMIKQAQKKGALTLIDAAQSIVHQKIDFKEIDADFLVFSAHKMCGPTGVGVLAAKYAVLENMQPTIFGGDMIESVTLEKVTYNKPPYKFEAGTPSIAQVIGLGAAIDYINTIGITKIQEHSKELAKYGYTKLKALKCITLYGPQEREPIFAFAHNTIEAADLARLLDAKDIAVRSGSHCAMPLMQAMGVKGLVRASCYLYTTKQDIDALVKALKEIKQRGKKK